ncbi:MAG: threonine/serine exporter family protein [Thermotaleaceae bacterium]
MEDARKKILILALYAGQIMLENGAETYRVEDTIVRICKAYHISFVESFVTPTGIFVSIASEIENEQVTTLIKRIRTRSINLNKISMVNDFSRKIVDENITLEMGMEQLKIIDAIPKYKESLRTICAGMASAFFGLLLGATYMDFISSFVISMFVYGIITYIQKKNTNLFLENVIGGILASLLGILSVSLNMGTNLDKIVISSIMILLPGVSITNAVRDSISGDLLSGLSRAAEAVIVAVSIAVGVGIVMNFWLYRVGVIGI